MRGELEARAVALGLAVGVAEARPFAAEEALLASRRAAGLEGSFEAGEPAIRARPEALLPGARSLVVAAMPYLRPFPGRPHPPWLRGEVAAYAWDEDYHRVLARRLAALAETLGGAAPGARHRAGVDAWPLLERAAAARAGLGWIGRHACLITPRWGSWVVLGALLTTASLEPDPPGPPPGSGCGDCRRCMAACPTGAIVAPGVVDHRLCLAHATQAPGYLPHPLRAALGRRVWGCDTCQRACPYNKASAPALAAAAAPVIAAAPVVAAAPAVAAPWASGEPPPAERARPYLPELAVMGAGEFRRRFGGTAGAWRGRGPWRRNALVALGNALAGPAELPRQAREDALSAFRRALAAGGPVLRAHAVWGLLRAAEGRGLVPAERAEARRLAAEAFARETNPAAARDMAASLLGTGQSREARRPGACW